MAIGLFAVEKDGKALLYFKGAMKSIIIRFKSAEDLKVAFLSVSAEEKMCYRTVNSPGGAL